jgi:hypothetical protein
MKKHRFVLALITGVSIGNNSRSNAGLKDHFNRSAVIRSDSRFKQARE